MWKVFKVLRNNWKKSLFGALITYYGVSYGQNKFKSLHLMKAYCQQAAVFGDEPLVPGAKIRQITVILNPAANKRKCKENFEKYCAPLFHLAGISLNVLHTESEGQACNLAENLNTVADAIVIAGGDGTVSETITGLLRRNNLSLPIGVLPLGRTNSICNSLFGNEDCNMVRMMADASMAVIKEITKPLDVLRVDVEKDDTEAISKPIYGLSCVEWGAFRDTNAQKDRYWYWGGLRSYASYFFMGFKSKGISWKCQANICYDLPCNGCSKCYEAVPVEAKLNGNSRWWKTFMPKLKPNIPSQPKTEVDVSQIINEHCGQQFEEEINTVQMTLKTSNTADKAESDLPPHVTIVLGPKTINYLDFVREGWKQLNGEELPPTKKFEVRNLYIKPLLDEQKDKENWISIDNEEYEVKPVHIKLLPNRINVFCNPK